MNGPAQHFLAEAPASKPSLTLVRTPAPLRPPCPRTERAAKPRLAALGLVVALHGVLASAWLLSFSHDRQPLPPPALLVSILSDPQPPVPQAPPSPPVQMAVPIDVILPDIAYLPPAPTAITVAAAPEPPQTIAPPAPRAAAAPAPARESYEVTLLRYLNGHKHYPTDARRRRQEGIVHLFFAMDRSGHVTSYRVAKGSGYATLDNEALAMIRRADPLPAPPPGFGGDPVELLVPVEFTLR